MAESLGYSFPEYDWSISCRQFFVQFSTLFSTYGKPLAPSAQHDRCERSVQMRLYNLSKRQFAIVFFVFFGCFGLSVIAGIAGPSITEAVKVNSSSVAKPKNFVEGPFIVRSPPVSSLHSQLWLMAEPILKNPIKASVTLPVTFFVEIYGLDRNHRHLLYNLTTDDRLRTLTCHETCEELLVLHLGFVDHPRYLMTITFVNLDNLPSKDVSDVEFTFLTFNPAFTQLQIWLRFMFLFLTFMSTCFFVRSMRRFPLHDWSIEQKWVALLLPLLLLFNNPIFPLNLLVHSWLTGSLDATFQATFVCALLMFWLCLYHGMRQNKRKFVTFYMPKLLIISSIWLSVVLISIWQEYQEIQDPTYNYRLDIGHFTVFRTLLFLMGVVYLLFLVSLLARTCSELRTMPFFDLRLKFVTGLVAIVVSIIVVIMCLKIGQKVLLDNFVTELSSHFNNSAEFFACYGLLNFYLYTMAYVYSPSKNAIIDSHFKDNPTLSMINDSDDEVVYGSDEETQALAQTTAKTYDAENEACN